MTLPAPLDDEERRHARITVVTALVATAAGVTAVVKTVQFFNGIRPDIGGPASGAWAAIVACYVFVNASCIAGQSVHKGWSAGATLTSAESLCWLLSCLCFLVFFVLGSGVSHLTNPVPNAVAGVWSLVSFLGVFFMTMPWLLTKLGERRRAAEEARRSAEQLKMEAAMAERAGDYEGAPSGDDDVAREAAAGPLPWDSKLLMSCKPNRTSCAERTTCSKAVLCCKAATHVTFWFFAVLLGFASMSESARAPSMDGLGELYTIDSEGYEVQMRMRCTGPADARPIVVFESGGGSSGADFAQVQATLSDDTHSRRVCSYDRAGYGLSWTGPGLRRGNAVATAEFAKLATAAGLPIDTAGSLVCVGHSVGGQVCRHHVETLTASSPAGAESSPFAGIVLLDSVPVNIWTARQALWNWDVSLDDAQAGQRARLAAVALVSLNMPWIGAIMARIVGADKVWQPAATAQLAGWQIGTVRNWNSQYRGLRDEVDSCAVGDHACFNASVVTDANMLPVPVWAVAALNRSVTCEAAGHGTTGSEQCADFVKGRAITDEVVREQSLLGTMPGSRYLECDGVCDHAFVWENPAYVAGVVEDFLASL